MVGKSRLSRTGARACAWAGRGCVLAAAAGAAMVLFGGGPATDNTPNQQATAVTQDPQTQPNAPTEPDTFDEFDLLAMQLTPWDGPTPDPVEGSGMGMSFTSETLSKELAYLGVIKMGERQRALMSVDGKQRFMKEGQSVGRTTLVSIAPDHVMIRQGRSSRRIDLKAAATDRLGYLGSNGPPVRLSNPGTFSEMGGLDPSERMRRAVADGVSQAADDSGAPEGVAEAKARNAERSRNAQRRRNQRNSRNTGRARPLPGDSSDGQEGS